MVIELVAKSIFFSSILHATYIQVKESAKLRQVMQTILTLGNALNQGTARGMALYSVCVCILITLTLLSMSFS